MLLSGGNMLLGSILPAMSSMLSEEGACLSSSQHPPNETPKPEKKNQLDRKEIEWLSSAGYSAYKSISGENDL